MSARHKIKKARLNGRLILDERPLGGPLTEALGRCTLENRLDLGCIAAHGIFGCDTEGCFAIMPQGKPATAFLFELIARLQSSATVPMIDIRAYARWLAN